MSSPLVELLKTRKILICGGSGGVGKTTSAAAIALLWASMGKKVMVMTIDPARRLADALGLQNIGSTPVQVDPAILSKAGIQGGSLSAMMLDAKGAWDELIQRYAPSQEVTEKILGNAFYQSLSDTFAGSHEYLALEKLHDLYTSGEYDALVIDTPPTKHALDFLEAPRRMNDFLDQKVIRWLVMPYLSAGRTGLKWFNKTGMFLFKKLEDATGIRVLKDVSEFFFHFGSLTEGSRERMKKVFAILQGQDSAFLLITSPEVASLSEATDFIGRIRTFQVPFAGVIANRVHRVSQEEPDQERLLDLLQQQKCPETLLEPLLKSYLMACQLGRGDQERLRKFEENLEPSAFLLQVPLYPRGLGSLAELIQFVDELRQSGQEGN